MHRQPFLALAEVVAAGAALCDYWPGVELDGFRRRRMVFPDGLRDVSGWQSQFSPARAWLLSADCGFQRKHTGHGLRSDHDGCHHRADGPVDMATGD